MRKNKELVIGTFYNEEKQKISSLNGSDLCFVVVVEDYDKFVAQTRKGASNSLAILSRSSASEEYANRFMELIEEWKVPNNKNWYRENPLQRVINMQSEGTAYPKIYKPN